MNVEFATCNKTTAIRYINSEYPDLEESDIPTLIDLIRKDIVRIRDPYMYGNIQVVAGKNYNESEHLKFIEKGINELKKFM